MAILRNIRKRGNTFVVIIISFLVVMFLGSELARIVPSLFSSKNNIGKLFGEAISYIDYRKAYKTQYHLAKQSKQQPTEEQVRHHAWRRLIDHLLYMKEIKGTGLAVGTQELVDLVQGEHIDAELIDTFKDLKTGAFDKHKLLNYLNNASKNEQEQWCEIEQVLALKRGKKKLHQLMAQSCFTTASEAAQAAQHASLLCNVDYLYIPFTSIKDNLIPLTNQQLKDYMAAHRSHYTSLSESRTIQYITFPIQPDEKDSAEFQKELNALLGQFTSTDDAYAFAKAHTDGNLADTRLVCTTDTLPTAFAPIKHTLKAGMVVGPTCTNSLHTLYKLVKQEKDNYEIAVIEKKPIISDHTRSKYLRQVTHLTNPIKTWLHFKESATNAHLTMHKETLAPSDGSIGAYGDGRKVVRWLYNEATVGQVSPLFDLTNVYLLAVMVDRVKAGDLVSLDSVYQSVYQKVLHQQKAKIILDKLSQIQATTLQDIAAQYGEGITVQSMERLRFLDNDAPHLKHAKAFVGKCFGLELNVISEPIIDDAGIFIACVKSKDKAATQVKPNEQMRQIERWMQPYYIGSAMEELAQVTDERYKIE